MEALFFAGITVVSVLAQWIAWALRLPAILFLLLTGLLLGPILGVLEPDLLLGDLLFPIINMSVAIILFEGALTLRIDELHEIRQVVKRLCFSGMFTTFTVITLASHYILGLDWRLALVLGSVLVVTGPTVIAPMLSVVRPIKEIDRILRWEGIVIDPIGALFAVLVFEAIMLGNRLDATTTSEIVVHMVWGLTKIVSVGTLFGIFSGWLTSLLIRKDILPVELHKFGVLSLVLASFTLSNALSGESGLLTVTVFGIWLANQKSLNLQAILEFKEDLSVILISSLFILLAARLDLNQLWLLGPKVILLLLVVQFIARPLCILVSARGSNLSWQAKALLSWIAPRGIVAAAVSSTFAISLAQAHIPDAEKLVPLVFAVIISTVVLQSLTSAPIASLLKLRQKQPDTLLIIGGNSVARAIGKALAEQNVPVHLSDPDWDNCAAARMLNLPCYFGNPQSEHAQLHLPLSNISSVLALSSNRNNNALGVLHFSHIYGEKKTFSLKSSNVHSKVNRESATFRARQNLFGDSVNFAKLSSMLGRGGSIKLTRLSDSFSWADYQQANPDSIPLFVFSNTNQISIVQSNQAIAPKSGESVMALHPPKAVVTS